MSVASCNSTPGTPCTHTRPTVGIGLACVSRRPPAAVVLFYGSQPANFSCPQCRAVYVGTGPKWRLVYRFTLLDEWREMRQRYRALLIPDDDLTVSAQHTLTRRCAGSLRLVLVCCAARLPLACKSLRPASSANRLP